MTGSALDHPNICTIHDVGVISDNQNSRPGRMVDAGHSYEPPINRLGDRAEASGVLDALLQLAPGFVQCTPALTDAVLGRVAAAQEAATRRSEPADAEARPSLPSFLALGGAADSCYMWRRDGPLLQIRPSSKEDGG